MKIRTAIAVAAVLIPTIIIPSNIASTVADNAAERETVEAYVRTHFLWTRNASLIRGWFEFVDLRTGFRYRMKKDDQFTARFADGSSVRFRFIGTIHCPSGLCFEWVIGSERNPRGERVPDRTSQYASERYYSPPISPGLSMVYFRNTKTYDPYDPANWSGPAYPNW